MHTDVKKNNGNGTLPFISSNSIGFDIELSKRTLLALIDDRPLTLESFTNFIDNSKANYSIRTFNNIEEFLSQTAIEINAVQIIVLNIGYQRIVHSLINDSIIKLKAQLPETPLVLIADCEEPECITQAINLGVHGYITTALMPAVVIAALNLVLEGGIFAPLKPLMANTKVDTPETSTCDTDTLYFTPRQLEVLEHVKRGEPNKVIAHKLGMQECTVKVHIRDIMKKLHATNRTQLVYNAEHINSNLSST